MGTLKTIGDRARIRVRDANSLVYSDDDIMALANGALHMIYDALVDIESVFVYGHSTITTADGTIEYTPSFTHQGFLQDGVWLSGESWFLKQVTEEAKTQFDYLTETSEPVAYYLTEGGDVGFLSVPDDAYTVYVEYWKPLTEMTTYDTDTLPWQGIWNQVIERLIASDMLEIQSRPGAREIVLADILWNQAMNKTLSYGVRNRRQRSNMFCMAGM